MSANTQPKSKNSQQKRKCQVGLEASDKNIITRSESAGVCAKSGIITLHKHKLRPV